MSISELPSSRTPCSILCLSDRRVAAELVLVEQAIEVLALDARDARRLREVLAVAREEVFQVRALEAFDELGLRVRERSIGSHRDLGGRGGRRAEEHRHAHE